MYQVKTRTSFRVPCLIVYAIQPFTFTWQYYLNLQTVKISIVFCLQIVKSSTSFRVLDQPTTNNKQPFKITENTILTGLL